MSWSPDLYIGELRPWPDTVHVVRGKTEETRRYVPERTCRDVADTPQYGYKTRFECSECGYEYSAVGGFGCDYGDEPDFRFCPNCGAKRVDA